MPHSCFPAGDNCRAVIVLTVKFQKRVGLFWACALEAMTARTKLIAPDFMFISTLPISAGDDRDLSRCRSFGPFRVQQAPQVEQTQDRRPKNRRPTRWPR